MGTRHFIGVKADGEYRIAQYGQWDGYPEGQGIGVLTFLRGANIDAFRAAVLECAFITQEDADKINAEIERISKSIPTWDWTKQYPQLCRDTGSDVLGLVLNKGVRKLKNSITFAADSLFCEWAYVIDLDVETFEVYKGFNQSPLDSTERFYFLQEEKANDNAWGSFNEQYYPVKLAKSWPLNELPTDEDFKNQFKDDAERSAEG